ncbi:MAG TPA: hypothetical protein VLI06_17390 [Solimonas sp.]|nr:hypothetical protein [Solimonas sp.]
MNRGFLLLLLVAALCACGGVMRPDLRRMYLDSTGSAQPPVIVIPGILGSRLRHRGSGEEIWPGPLWRVALGDQAQLALQIDPRTLEPLADDIEPHALFEGAAGRDFYGALIRTLAQDGGFSLTQAGTPVRGRARRYYLFPYDWRQDNVLSARRLDALIEQIRRDHGDPKLRVDIVAHSMGGLITRYFLRYGSADVLGDNELPISYAGAAKVRTAILLGTPNLGSASSLHSFLVGADIGLRRVPPEVLATMPSTYQLFPHPLNRWLVTPQGEALDRDLFDSGTWQRFQWSVYDPQVIARLQARGQDPAVLQRYFDKRLERARRFVWALTRQLDHSPERLVVFGGNCRPTPARLLVEEDGGDSVARLEPGAVRHRVAGIDYEALMLEPGDGQVTKPSLLARENLNPALPRHAQAFFPLAYSFFLCEEHQRLTGNVSFQDNLLNVLLMRERPFDQMPEQMRGAPRSPTTRPPRAASGKKG